MIPKGGQARRCTSWPGHIFYYFSTSSSTQTCYSYARDVASPQLLSDTFDFKLLGFRAPSPYLSTKVSTGLDCHLHGHSKPPNYNFWVGHALDRQISANQAIPDAQNLRGFNENNKWYWLTTWLEKLEWNFGLSEKRQAWEPLILVTTAPAYFWHKDIIQT